MEKHEVSAAVGKRIRAIRDSKNLTQKDLAYLCGRDKQSLERIENGKINTSIYMLYVIATALEVKLADLVDFPDISKV